MKRSLFLGLLTVLASIGAIASPTFLLLDGIQGESLDARHRGWIELDGFSEGVSRAPTALKPAFLPVSVTKRTDRSSPPLILACANGTKIKTGVMEVLRSAGNRLLFLEVRLTNVTVGSFQQSGRDGSASVPTETLSFGFEAVQWTYTEIDAAGRPLREIVCTWNRVTGTGTGGDQPLDSDDDGLPDDYERRYGLDPTTPDATGDLDGDGLSNLDEFRAGTIPDSKDSVFRMTGTQLRPGKFSLRWTNIPGKAYRLLAATTVDGPFVPVQNLDPVDGPEGTLEVEATPGHQFYIIEAR